MVARSWRAERGPLEGNAGQRGMPCAPCGHVSRSQEGDTSVNYPITAVRGLQLRSITLPPSGALRAVHPYQVHNWRQADNQSGAVLPVNAQEAPTIPRLLVEPGACLWLLPP